jgi:hypothetical protein
MGIPELTRAHLRLREELDDDGISLFDQDQSQADLLIQELEHARRPPVHEGRSPVYGSFVLPLGVPLGDDPDLVDLITLELPIEQCRTFADGRSSFLVRSGDGPPQLACFRRSIQYEADLIHVMERLGAAVVQRTLLGVARVFTSNGVVEWNGHDWTLRPSARSILRSVQNAAPESPVELLAGMLDLCVHWLSPSHIGATLLLDVDPVHDDSANLDLAAGLLAPPLFVTSPHHYPALFAALQQTDLAALVTKEGLVTHLGVGLRSSVEAEDTVTQERGMRHRSAARFTWDHDHTVAFVVSEDGPVTVFRRGKAIAECGVNC